MIAALLLLAAALDVAPAPVAANALADVDVAEVNHYPGPKRVLDLGAKLGLSGEQRATIKAAFAEMNAEARRLGAAVVDAERALDARFAAGDLAAPELERLVADVAVLQGKLRAAHLRAHLVTRAALTTDQLARYEALRGHDHGAAGHHH